MMVTSDAFVIAPKKRGSFTNAREVCGFATRSQQKQQQSVDGFPVYTLYGTIGKVREVERNRSCRAHRDPVRSRWRIVYSVRGRTCAALTTWLVR
jgi:hypothetical protein